jgi:hypothetical protein
MTLPTPGEAAAGHVCGIPVGFYSSKFESDMDRAVGETSTLSLQLSGEGAEITFGNAQTMVGFSSKRLRCSGAAIRFKFEDNWGNKGRVQISPSNQGVAVVVDLLKPAKDTGFRDTTSLYPSSTVLVSRGTP